MATTEIRPIDIETLEKTYSVVPFVSYETAYDSFAISPAGDRIAFTWNRGGNYQIWLIGAEGGDPRQLTAGDDSAVSPAWTPDGRHIIFSRDRQGDERYNFYRLDPETGEMAALATNPDVARRSLSFSPDGSRIAFTSDEGGGAFNVWTMTAAGDDLRRLTAADMPAFAAAWSPVSTKIAFLRMMRAPSPRMRLGTVDAGTGAERIVAEVGGMGGFLRWTPDGRSVLVQDDASGVEQLVLVNVASGAKRPLASGDWEQPGGEFAPDGGSIVYAVNRDGNYELLLHDLTTGDETPLAVRGGMHCGARFTPDGRELVVVFTGAMNPPDLWRLPLDGGAPLQLTSSLPDEIAPSSLSDARVVRYPTFDGKDVPAMYYPPADGAPSPPAVVYVHGGPTSQHTNLWSPLIPFFTSNGFAVLAPNVRGSTGYGVAWRDAAIHDWGGGDLRDLVAGRDYLAREGLADERRIAVIGPSYGGYMTLMAMTQAPEKWGAGVSIVGIVNLRTLYDTTREGDLKPYLIQQIGTPDDEGRFYDERSPLNFVERVQAPLLLLQGANDPRVPLAEAEQMAERLRQAERTFELKVYPDEGHGFMKTANRLDSLRTAMVFLRKHMG